MKRIFHIQGIYFLTSLAIIWIVAGGYLLSEFFGDPPLSGAAAALETPVVPPAISPAPDSLIPLKEDPSGRPVRKESSSLEILSPPIEKIDKLEKVSNVTDGSAGSLPKKVKSTEKTDEVLAQSSAQDGAPPENSPEISTLADDGSGEVKLALEDNKNEAGKTQIQVQKPLNNETKALKKPLVTTASKRPIVFATASSTDNMVEMLRQEIPQGDVRVKNRCRPVQTVEEQVPTEVPPEWAWFDKPLKLEYIDGRVQIVPDESAHCSSELHDFDYGNSFADTMTNDLKEIDEPLIESESTLKSGEEPEDSPQVFERALERMERLRTKRMNDKTLLDLDSLPSTTGNWEFVPEPLREMTDMLQKLIYNADHNARTSSYFVGEPEKANALSITPYRSAVTFSRSSKGTSAQRFLTNAGRSVPTQIRSNSESGFSFWLKENIKAWQSGDA